MGRGIAPFIYSRYTNNNNMKVYIVYESSDYGLWDMTDAKIFSKLKDAEAYNEEYYKQHGYTLVINEWNVD